MITHERLRRKPVAFKSMTGMTVAEFDTLFDAFQPAQAQRRQAATRTKRSRQPRRRAPGAGHPRAHDERTRLLMALVWLRVYPTYEVLGLLFNLEKGNVWDNVQDVLASLETLAVFAFERPTTERKRLGTVAAVMDAFPQVRLVIDGKEQRIERPEGYERQKPYYSGKKKAHTLKNQVAAAPDGRIEAVSASVPGGANHDLTLLRQTGVLDQLDPEADEGAMLDKGYVGIQNDHPELPLILPAKATRGHPLTEEQKASNRVIARYRIVVEHVLAQLNRFQVLKQVFRSMIPRHDRVIRIVAMLVNRRIAIQPLRVYAAA
jgi:hypothetical protein